jgi:hypothetical protein
LKRTARFSDWMPSPTCLSRDKRRMLSTGGITNRWTGARVACFATRLIRRRLDVTAAPGQLNRSRASRMTTRSLIVGFLFSTVGGALVLWLLISRLAWWYISTGGQRQNTAPSLTIPLGLVERALYTAAILFGFYEWIAVWLALKVAVGWPHSSRQPPSDNLYLIGNALSVAFGFFGAVIAHGAFPPWGPK